MPRYIDADKLIAHLKDEIKECEIPFGSRANGKGIAYGTALGLKSAISFAETLSTADVVPKSECDKWYYEYHAIKDELKQEKMYHKETEKLVDKYCVELQTAKSEVERLQAEKDALIKNYAECMKNYASEIFAEIESLIDGKFSINHGVVLMSKEDFAELKKKYTKIEVEN